MAIIQEFNLDTKDIYASGETRNFSITAENGAVFSLEIKNEDSYYYNFFNNTFQATKTGLRDVVVKGNIFSGSVTFPTVTDADQYDVYLWAGDNTEHVAFQEVRFNDGSLDINSSKGSNSLLIQKVIYQTLNINLTLTAMSINATTPWGSVSVTDATIPTTVGKSSNKQSFTVKVGTAATKAQKINRQPSSGDVIVAHSRTVGSAPENIVGESIYPAVSNTDTIDGAVTSGVKVVMDNNVADNMVVGDRITATATTDTVDGAVDTDGTKVVMDAAVATKMAVRDRVTGTAELDAGHFVVKALNPDGDNANEFEMGDDADTQSAKEITAGISDGVTLTFTSQLNRTTTTVAALNPDTDNVKEFSMSQAIALADGITLNFSNRKNYRWPLDNINGLLKGNVIHVTGNAVAGTIADYVDSTTLRQGLEDEEVIIHREISALDTLGKKSTRTVNGTTKLVTDVQPGNVVFSTQQVLALAGDSIKFYGYGQAAIKDMTGWDVEFSNLQVELTDSTYASGTKPTTTTTGTVSSSATIGVADREGIVQNVSTISGIGIAVGAVNPTITSTQADGSGNWTASAAQTLENGITLTIDNTSRFAIITGDVEIKQAGSAALSLAFDLEKFIFAN